MAPSEQIAALRTMRSNAIRLKYGLASLALGLAIVALMSKHPAYAAVLAFVALVTFSSWQTAPHILYAGEAFDLGSRSHGTVQIRITNWSDSDTYHATVNVSPSQSWRFEFIPLGWQPTEGEFEAELFAHPSVEWPALAQTDQGILHPRYKPKRVSHEADA